MWELIIPIGTKDDACRHLSPGLMPAGLTAQFRFSSEDKTTPSFDSGGQD
jgi:hypothetical protein